MEVANKEIRKAIEKSGLYKYQIAHEIGVSDAWFSKILRYELPEEKKAEIRKAIKKLKKEG